MTLHFSVLGAGLMGRLVALALSGAGHRVEIYERGGPDGAESAAHAAAAMLAPLAESVIAEPIVAELGLRSLDLWPGILAALPEPVFFQRNGTLIVWHPQDRDQAALFSARLRLQAPAGRPAAGAQELRSGDIAELEPALGSRFTRGLFLPGEGQLDNRGALTALRSALEASGADLHWHTDMAPEYAPGDFVVDCRGLGARRDWADLRGVRGEVLRVHTEDVELHRPVRLLHPRYPLYIVPKPAGVFVVGATEIETEDASPASVRSALELMSALYSVHPAFGEARILELSAQCRPALPDNLPGIRWDGGRLVQVNGLYRHGWLIAPALRDAVLDLLRYAAGENREEWDLWRAGRELGSLYHLNANA
jgi:glycine oxidase